MILYICNRSYLLFSCQSTASCLGTRLNMLWATQKKRNAEQAKYYAIHSNHLTAQNYTPTFTSSSPQLSLECLILSVNYFVYNVINEPVVLLKYNFIMNYGFTKICLVTVFQINHANLTSSLNNLKLNWTHEQDNSKIYKCYQTCVES